MRARRDLIGLVRGMVRSDAVGVLWATHLFDDLGPDDWVVLLHKGRVLADERASVLAGGGPLEQAFLRLTGVSHDVARA